MKCFRLPLSCRALLGLVAAMFLGVGVSEAQSAVTFKAIIAITETIQPIGTPPCILAGAISGTGQATQLGKVTIVSTDCINPISQTAFSYSSDQLVITVANGNQIFAMYNGTLTTEGGVGVIHGGYQIVGGTGRYLHASGAGTVQGVEDMTTGKGLVYLNGTISY